MTTQPQRAQLRDFIVEHFSREELFTFCSDYFRDFYQDNQGSSITKSALARDLVEYCEQRDLVISLKANLQRVREKPYLAQFERIAIAEVKTQPRNPKQVFISHAHEDVDFAKRLAQDLREAGLSVWMTPDNIQPGEQWASAIERGLDESGIFLVLLTPNSVKSRWVRRETLYALQHDHIFDIAPVIAKTCDVAQLSKFLTQIQYLSFENDYERGLDALCQRLGVQSAAMKAANRAAEVQRQREVAERERARLAAEQAHKQREAEELAQLRAENERLTKALDEQKRQQAANEHREQLPQENESLKREMSIGRASQTPAKPATVDEIAIPMGNGFEMLFRRIPAGKFLMGSEMSRDKLGSDWDLPKHSLILPEYFIGKYLVTNVQWRIFSQATSRNFEFPQVKDSHPVVKVSWHDAMDFCNWLSKKSGRKVTLPSESEWEKAARGTDGHIYPWGDNPPTKDLLNFGQNVGDTTPVGQYSPKGDSPFGCADMAGNVWEWTRSLWGKDSGTPKFKYPYVVSDGRENLTASDIVYRVVRGGAWYGDHQSVRAAYRFRFTASLRRVILGFRVVISAPV